MNRIEELKKVLRIQTAIRDALTREIGKNLVELWRLSKEGIA